MDLLLPGLMIGVSNPHIFSKSFSKNYQNVDPNSIIIPKAPF